MKELNDMFDQRPRPLDDKERLRRMSDEELTLEFQSINVAFAEGGLGIPLEIVLENVNEVGEGIDNIRSISGDIAATTGNVIATLAFLDNRDRPLPYGTLEDTILRPAARFGFAVEEMRNRNADRPEDNQMKLPVELTVDPRLQLKPKS